MAKTGVTGIRRIIHAGGYSWQGLKAAFRHEAAFRQELFLLLAGAPLAIVLGDDNFERCLMIAALVFILVVEILNSAIEAVVDRFGDELHELAGRAKDMGSAAVLLAFIVAALLWAAVLLD